MCINISVTYVIYVIHGHSSHIFPFCKCLTGAGSGQTLTLLEACFYELGLTVSFPVQSMCSDWGTGEPFPCILQ